MIPEVMSQQSSVSPSQKPRSAMTRLKKGEREREAEDEMIARIVLPHVMSDAMRGHMSGITTHANVHMVNLLNYSPNLQINEVDTKIHLVVHKIKIINSGRAK